MIAETCGLELVNTLHMVGYVHAPVFQGCIPINFFDLHLRFFSPTSIFSSQKTAAEGKQFSSKPSRSSDVRPKSEPKCSFFFETRREYITRYISRPLQFKPSLCPPCVGLVVPLRCPHPPTVQTRPRQSPHLFCLVVRS